jgi:hypothetical protein
MLYSLNMCAMCEITIFCVTGIVTGQRWRVPSVHTVTRTLTRDPDGLPYGEKSILDRHNDPCED